MTVEKFNQLTYKNIPYYRTLSDTLTERELSAHQRKHFLMLDELFKMANESDNFMYLGMYEKLIKEDYNFQLTILNNDSSFYEGYTLVNLTLGYCSSKPISLYIDNSTLYMFEAISIDLSLYKPDTLLN